MKKTYSALRAMVALLLVAALPAMAVTRTWVGTTSSDWNTAGNWIPAATPTASDALTITNGNARYPVITTGTTAAALSIVMGGVNTGAKASILMTGGTMNNAGALIVSNATTIEISGGTWNNTGITAITNASAITNSGGVINFVGATTNFSGSVFAQTAGSNSTPGGFTVVGNWTQSGGTNCSSGGAFVNSGGVLTISGGLLHMAANTATAPTDAITITGSLVQTGGTNAVKDLSGAGTLSMTGGWMKLYHDFKPTTPANFAMTGGTVEFAGAGGGATFGTVGTYQFYNILVDSGIDPGWDGVANTIEISGSFTNNGSPLFTSTATTARFDGNGNDQFIAGSSVTTFATLVIANTNATVTAVTNMLVATAMVVTNGAAFDCTTRFIGGAGTFNLGSGGTLEIGSATGIYTTGTVGSITNAGTRSFSTNANYIFSGTVAQNTGTGYPTTNKSLTINNTSATVTISNVSTKVFGPLTLAAGAKLALPTGTTTVNSFTYGGTNKVAGTWGNTGSGATNINANYFAASGLLSVLTGPSDTNTVTSSANPYYVGQSSTFTATITGAGPAVPSGTIQFKTNGVNFGSAVTLSGGSATSASVSLPQGTNTITAVYSGDENFPTNTATLSGGQVVNPKLNQTITFNALGNKTYGDATFGVAATASSGLTVTFSVVSGPATLSSGTNVTLTGAGSVTIRASQAGDATNNAAADVDRSFTVAAKSVTPVVTANSKTYDTTTNATIATRSLTGVINSDDATLTGGTASFATKTVGTGKTVTVTNFSITGTKSTNYVLSASSATTTADITAASLTVTATGVNRAYNATTNATVTVTNTPLAGDTVNASYTTASFATKTVGTGKTVTVTGISISGADAGNYTANTSTTTTADITAATLSVTATGVNKVYDGTTNATVNLTNNAFAGDVVNNSYTAASFADANVGTGKTVTVTGISISGADSGNYSANTSTTTTADITAASTSGSVATSLNPALPTSNVVFTATITSAGGTPTGTVQFKNNGAALGSPATLSGGVTSITNSSLTHGYHTITAEYAGDGNFSGTTNTLSPNQLINTPPVAGADVLSTRQNRAVTGALGKLLINDTDADSDARTLASIVSVSAQSGTISSNGSAFTYTPASGYTGADSFTYTISDGYTTATGTVNITVYAATNGPERVVSQTTLPDGNQRLVFAGVPGYSYIIQATTNLSPAFWVNIATNTASANGLFTNTDLHATNYPSRYYRDQDR